MIELQVTAGANAATSLTAIKLLAAAFPGAHDLTLVVRTPEQVVCGLPGRRLTLGPAWRYSASTRCLAALRTFGKATVC